MRISFASCFLSFLALAVLFRLSSSCQSYDGAAQQVHTAQAQRMREETTQMRDNWVKSNLPLGRWGEVITFGNDGHVAILGQGSILISSDKGEPWKPLSGGEGSWRRTVDGGNTYRNFNQLGEPLPSSVTLREFCSPQSAAITSSGRLYVKTMCEHITQLWSVPVKKESDPWNVVSFTYETDPSDGVYTPGRNLVVVGERILIDAVLPDGPALLTTDNNGATWYPYWRGSDSDADILGLSFIDERVGWMLQEDGTLNKTTDGGRTWNYLFDLSSVSAKRGFALDFVSSQAGFIVGFGGLILSTADGGSTWHRQSAPTAYYLYRVEAADAKRVWVVGEKGTVLQTTDGGAHWQELDLGIKKDIIFGLTVKNGTAWIVSDGVMFHSS